MMRSSLIFILSLLSFYETKSSSFVSGPDNIIIDTVIAGPGPVSEVITSLEFNLPEATIKGFLYSTEEKYKIQLGAFRIKSNAEAFYEKVIKFIGDDAIMIFESGYYKVRLSGSTQTTGYINDNSSSLPATLSTDTISLNYRNSEQTRHKVFFMQSESPWLKRINYFGKSLTFVNALIVSIVVSISSMLILLIIILLNRRRMEKEDKLHQYLLERYQGLIIDYLFGNTSPDDFRPIASDTYRRQVLIDQMIDVSINLKGEEAKKLTGLYKHLGLDRDSIIRANDYRWHKKIKGFRELAFMNIRDANDAIYKALNSSNEILRMEAQIALVRLSDDNPFEFLSHLTRPFSLWEQITLHELIIQHNIAVPFFKKWLKSPNSTVIMFALRMIREFRQTDAEEDIRETLVHPDPVVRHLAVQVAGDLELRSTLEVMKRMFKNQEYNICLEIVRSMGKMPDLSMMGFLKLVLDKEDDVQLQIEATKAIENMGEEGVKALVKIMKSEYKNYNIIVRHVLDRRIF